MSTPTQTTSQGPSGLARLRELWNAYLPYWFITPMVLVMLLITIFPGAYDLYLSLVKYQLTDPNTIGQFNGLANYERVFTSGGAINSFVITITFVAGALALETGIGFVLAALVTGVKSDRMKAFYRIIFIIPMAVAPVSLATIGRIMLNTEIGIVPYLVRELTPFVAPNFLSDVPLLTVILVDTWNWTPFMFIIFYAGMSSVPTTLLEASKVDGAPLWRRYVHVIIPYMKPVLFVAILIRLIDLFRTFGLVFSLTSGGPGTATELVSINIFQTGFTFVDLGGAAAIAIVYLVGIIALCNILIIKVGFEGVWD
ncbi:carbohydrate ABC transporter permease [Halobellus limi]|jgi:multiple sugar transport system permease protein|uniref:Multiple sugar transport system permease protein n=1 Tax=Halobellus limi TaxID=699433 RepID=A0A1H6CR90_9EURY|nr:sugar ABC transporter permease [Halobellus limi]QCC49089.1 sugar ABC transporter permease [Halobellus limi]SEG75504.1 multiple sugar transport system permease protein [Halobellus limi]